MKLYLMCFGLGLVGVVLGTLAFRWLLGDANSISDWWLYCAMLVPIGGVILGAWLGHRGSAGAVPWPLAHNQRFVLAAIGAPLAALANYITYGVMSQAWFGGELMEMLLDPSLMGTISSTRRGSSVDSPLWFAVVIGFVVGAYGTWSFLKIEDPGPPG